MGTNYYHRTNICPECGRYDEQHIGKSSAGWSFGFQGTPTIRSYKDWLLLLGIPGSKIFDEYGREISLEDFKANVEAKRNGKKHSAHYPGPDNWIDEEGHSFSGYEFS